MLTFSFTALLITQVLVVQAEPSVKRVAVLPLLLDTRAARELPSLVDDVILHAVEQAGPYQAIGHHDIEALLDLEAQKELLGCEPTWCWVDLAGAMGADHHLSFRVLRKGHHSWVAVGKLGRVTSGGIEHLRSVTVEGSATDFLAQMVMVVREILQAPPPEPVVRPSYFEWLVQQRDPALATGEGCSREDPADCEAQCLRRNAASCDSLGAMYLTGRNVPRVWGKAAIFFEQGCALGAASACNSLGVLHHFGFGVDEEPPRARSLFERACIDGEDLGCEHLWRLFLRRGARTRAHM